MNEPLIHCREMMFSILSRNPNKLIFLKTMYSAYSNVFIKSFPNTPKVTIIRPNVINAPIIYDIIIVLLYCFGLVNIFLGIIRIVNNGK